MQQTTTMMRKPPFERRVATRSISLLFATPLLPAADAKRTAKLIAGGTRWATPCYIQDSGVPGPTVLIVGGVHGNEPAGTYAADAVRHWPITRGKLIVLPRANVPALRAGARRAPNVEKDQADLNRNFPRPGKTEPPRGGLAKEIWRLASQHKVGWLLDMHESYDYRHASKKALGGSLIVCRTASAREASVAMLAAVNATIDDKDKHFVRLPAVWPAPPRSTWARGP